MAHPFLNSNSESEDFTYEDEDSSMFDNEIESSDFDSDDNKIEFLLRRKDYSPQTHETQSSAPSSSPSTFSASPRLVHERGRYAQLNHFDDEFESSMSDGGSLISESINHDQVLGITDFANITSQNFGTDGNNKEPEIQLEKFLRSQRSDTDEMNMLYLSGNRIHRQDKSTNQDTEFQETEAFNESESATTPQINNETSQHISYYDINNNNHHHHNENSNTFIQQKNNNNNNNNNDHLRNEENQRDLAFQEQRLRFASGNYSTTHQRVGYEDELDELRRIVKGLRSELDRQIIDSEHITKHNHTRTNSIRHQPILHSNNSSRKNNDKVKQKMDHIKVTIDLNEKVTKGWLTSPSMITGPLHPNNHLASSSSSSSSNEHVISTSWPINHMKEEEEEAGRRKRNILLNKNSTDQFENNHQIPKHMNNKYKYEQTYGHIEENEFIMNENINNKSNEIENENSKFYILNDETHNINEKLNSLSLFEKKLTNDFDEQQNKMKLEYEKHQKELLLLSNYQEAEHPHHRLSSITNTTNEHHHDNDYHLQDVNEDNDCHDHYENEHHINGHENNNNFNSKMRNNGDHDKATVVNDNDNDNDNDNWGDDVERELASARSLFGELQAALQQQQQQSSSSTTTYNQQQPLPSSSSFIPHSSINSPTTRRRRTAPLPIQSPSHLKQPKSQQKGKKKKPSFAPYGGMGFVHVSVESSGPILNHRQSGLGQNKSGRCSGVASTLTSQQHRSNRSSRIPQRRKP